MPYDEAHKAQARKFTNKIRSQTVCESCGSQPIEWHHDDHLEDENQRVARLASLGFPIERIQQEIDKCQALCRRCHMELDGRLDQFRGNQPYQKGQTYTDPEPCNCCGVPSKPTRRGFCRKCYDFRRRGTGGCDGCADRCERGY